MAIPATFDPFLRAILAAPEDELPRLIAADWCADQGLTGVDAMLRSKRLPADGWTVRACRALTALDTLSRFIRDVCPGIEEYTERPPKTRPAGPVNRFAGVIARTHDRLSPKQYLWVWRLVLKYRLRVRDDGLLARAAELLPAAIVEAP